MNLMWVQIIIYIDAFYKLYMTCLGFRKGNDAKLTWKNCLKHMNLLRYSIDYITSDFSLSSFK